MTSGSSTAAMPAAAATSDDRNAENSTSLDDTLESPDAAECGNGRIDPGEECEDGNDTLGDGCENCRLTAFPDALDDGNDVDDAPRQPVTDDVQMEIADDAQETDDAQEANDDPDEEVSSDDVGCGDGALSAPEQCDDGNQADGDGCSANCLIEENEQPGDVNIEEDEPRAEICGDGIVASGEGCDDNNAQDGDGCSSSCERETCGDGMKTPNEECDDGNQANDDGCSSSCKNEVCGDGIVQPSRGEQCEDLNTDDTDLCRNGCRHQASLNSLSSSCAFENQITQTVCMVATANWCGQYGEDPIAGMVTGGADNEYTVGCIDGFERHEVPQSQLDQCPGGRQQSPNCLGQINEACRELGADRGFYLGTGSSGTYAVACDVGSTFTESISDCNGISGIEPVPVSCAQALSNRCGDEQGGMIQAPAESNEVTFTCIDLTLTGEARQF